MKAAAEILGNKQTYTALLNTDEWRAFARVIRKQRGGACECCRQSNKELHVHHFFYDPNKKPWEANGANVIVLCRECHTELHKQLQSFRRYVFRFMNPGQFRVLNGALAVGLTRHNPLEFVYAVAEMASSPGSVKRFAEAWQPHKDQNSAAEMPVSQ